MKTLRLLFFMLVVVTLARAGGGRYDNIVIDQVGNAVAGATIRVCVAGAINLPCSPTAQIFQDLGLTIVKSNPFNADSLGNFFFYAQGGLRYTVQISGINITTHTMPDQFVPDITGVSVSCDATNCFINGGNSFTTTSAKLGTINAKDLIVNTNNVERFRTSSSGFTTFGVNSTGIGIFNTGTNGAITWPGAFIKQDTSIHGQIIGYGDGVTKHFIFDIRHYPIKTGSIKVFDGVTQEGTDNGAGALSGVGITSGTINYANGHIDVTLVAAPATGDYVSVTDVINSNLLVGTTAPHAFFDVSGNDVKASAIGAEFAALSYLSLATPPVTTPANAFLGSIDLYAKNNATDPVGDKKIYYVDQSGVEKELCTTTGSCGGGGFPLDITTAYEYDDFLFGSDTIGAGVPDYTRNGSIGNGWTQEEGSGLVHGWTELGVADTEVEQTNHPGILYLTAPDDVGDSFVTILAPTGITEIRSPSASTDKTFHWRAVLNAYQIETGVDAPNTSLQQSFGLFPGAAAFTGDLFLGFGYTRAFNEPQGPTKTIDTPGNSGLVRSANVVTVKTTTAHTFTAGRGVTIAGATDASFDGFFLIVSTPTLTTFTYAQTDVDATSGDGTAEQGNEPPTHWHVVHGDEFAEADIEHTSVTVNTTYHLFEILHTGGTTIYEFKIDGAIVATVDFDFKAYFGTKSMLPFFTVYESSGGISEKYMGVDFYDLLISGLTRYTP